ncbi:ANTAR domain-containing protein [Streptomyces sp. NPDC016845]|uniref:ANTAR domain-containing protein n=1 Tax=Streptomyces sp. NPDC016845 TaxID=3364972 RepID=UPI003796D89E
MTFPDTPQDDVFRPGHLKRLESKCERLELECERLTAEANHLRLAVTSHATIDQAIGALVVLGRMPPEEAWRALRDISQRTNTKLRTVADDMLRFAAGGALAPYLQTELRNAVERYGV